MKSFNNNFEKFKYVFEIFEYLIEQNTMGYFWPTKEGYMWEDYIFTDTWEDFLNVIIGLSNEDITLEDRVVLEEFAHAVAHCSLIEQYGGEDMGRDYYTIYSFPTWGLTVKFDGWYQSYHGSEFSEMYEVEPKEVTVVKYERVNYEG